MMRLLLGAAAFAFVALCAFIPSTAATIEGPCDGIVAGRDVDRLSASNPADAIVVGPADTVSYTFSAASNVTQYDTEVGYGPYSATVDGGAPDEGHSDAEGTLDVSQFRTFGVGLYRVEAHAGLADGTSCSAAFLLKIHGSVLSSSVGKAATALVVLAGGGLVAISAMAASGAKTVLVSLKAVL
jgi:hypothetical protein